MTRLHFVPVWSTFHWSAAMLRPGMHPGAPPPPMMTMPPLDPQLVWVNYIEIASVDFHGTFFDVNFCLFSWKVNRI